MNRSARDNGLEDERRGSAWHIVRRAFAEFLWFPTLIVAGFLILAALCYALERSNPRWLQPASMLLREHLFADPRSTADLLGIIAGSLITVTSITISLLLVALQQAAGSLTFEVFDQFLRRRLNQFYFGFFVGVAVFALITLATVNEPFNPVLAASFAFILTVAALLFLIVLLYTTINQMRPVEIIEAVHDLTVAARTRQLSLVRRTRRRPLFAGNTIRSVLAERHGFVTRIDLDSIESCAATVAGAFEIDLRVSMGSFAAFNDTLAVVSAADPEAAATLADAVLRAIRLERQRDIIHDPAYGIEQLETIAWTSISTSKSNPAPGQLTIQSLRDLLARWAIDDRDAPDPTSAKPVPVVYQDNVVPRVFEALETLAVVSTESMQHMNFIEVVRAFTVLFERLPTHQQDRACDLVLRILSGLGDHVLTAELDAALTALAEALATASRPGIAIAVEAARSKLASTVGELHSRSTRAS